MVGLAFTVFNFAPQAEASVVHYGTLEWVIDPDPWMEPYHVGDLGYYCLGDPCDCCVVIEV